MHGTVPVQPLIELLLVPHYSTFLQSRGLSAKQLAIRKRNFLMDHNGVSLAELLTHLKQMYSTNKSSTCNNRVFVNDSLFQVSLNLCKKCSICDSTQYPNSICSVHVSSAGHVLHQGTCDNNDLFDRKRSNVSVFNILRRST